MARPIQNDEIDRDAHARLRRLRRQLDAIGRRVEWAYRTETEEELGPMVMVRVGATVRSGPRFPAAE